MDRIRVAISNLYKRVSFSLYAVSLSAIRNLNSHEIGHFISTIHICVILTVMFLLQQPSRHQKLLWCDTLRDFCGAYCPCSDFYNLDMFELVTLLES
jgi:hypothetical protein